MVPISDLSPHLRGNHHCIQDEVQTPGSIPAPAGEPVNRHPWSPLAAIYPRTCEGTTAAHVARVVQAELSPHLRGKQPWFTLRPPSPGTIPAPAGEPLGRSMEAAGRAIYPRTCGGTPHRCVPGGCQEDLSPHLRGNRDVGLSGGECARSIPTHAGEPASPCNAPRRGENYPRTCGGTTGFLQVFDHHGELSPHLRGNRAIDGTGGPDARSIPAPAGGTTLMTWAYRYERICPHPCRGNLGAVPRSLPALRSIPAPAGEPCYSCFRANPGWIYPRTCGGTALQHRRSRGHRDLSPHLRGNLFCGGLWETPNSSRK